MANSTHLANHTKTGDRIDALEARLTSWQPIATAPVDEAVLTIWDGVDIKSGEPARYWNVAALHSDGFWYLTDEYQDCIDTPTHWMPLPDPPAD